MCAFWLFDLQMCKIFCIFAVAFVRNTIMDITSQIRQPIAEAFHQYESQFEQAMHSDNVLLDQVLRYIAAKRGKQLRPTLVLLSANLCREVSDKTILTAVALEILHNATLVHDDVVDNSPTRRGVPSVQSNWTNKVAVLVGDWMLALFKEAAGLQL